MRIDLIGPARLPRVGVAGEERRRPFVVTGTLVRIPRTGIAAPVINQVEIGIVGDPAPDVAAADLPRLRGPARLPEILAAILRIEWLEVRTDQHVRIGPGVVGLPDDLAVILIQGRDPAAHAHLAAGIADQDLALDHERRHGDGLADMDVAEF